MTRISNTISITINKKTLDKKGLIAATKHNFRLTKQASVIHPERGAFHRVNTEGKVAWKKIQIDKQKMLNLMAKKYDDMEAKAKAIINDKNNFDNPRGGKSGKMKRWGRLKHNLVSEAVIHVGKGYSDNINSFEALEIIHTNFTQWVDDLGMGGLVSEPVLHKDEKGQNHLHILFFATDPKTGLRVNYKNTEMMEDLQSRIAHDMEQFGLRRGDSWKDNPSRKKRHETILEYGHRMDQENAQDDILKNIKKDVAEKSEQVSFLTGKVSELNSEIETKQKHLDTMGINPIEKILKFAIEYRDEHCECRKVFDGYDENNIDKYKDEYSFISPAMWTDFVQTVPEALIPYLNYVAHDAKLAHSSIKTKYGYMPVPPHVINSTTMNR